VISGAPVGIQGNASDSFSSNSQSRFRDVYISHNCDALLRYYQETRLAEITAQAMIEVARTQAGAATDIARIGAGAANHASDNTLEATRDTNRTTVRVLQSTNQTSLATTGIQAGAGVLGLLFNNSSQGKDRELALQLQRERQQHELRILELQREMSLRQSPQPTTVNTNSTGGMPMQQTIPVSTNYQVSPSTIQAVNMTPQPGQPVSVGQQSAQYSQPVPTVAILAPLEQEIKTRLGLDIDPTCARSSLIIKAMNGQTVCAFPRPPYIAGRYFYNGQILTPMN
jgi:hypothetical protein